MKKPTIWIYTSRSMTPIAAASPDRLVVYLNDIPTHWGALDIIEGNSTFRISAKTAQHLASELIRKGATSVSILGEAMPIECSDDFITLLYRVKTERLYLDGDTVKTSATTKETALRG